MRLNLGCCDRHEVGFVNVDLYPPADLIHDLSTPWPWPDASVAEIRAYDCIEHLPDRIQTMNEAWRVLEPGGIFDIRVPDALGPGGMQDPTHVSFWTLNSFRYYLAGDPHRERFGKHYGIEARFKAIHIERRWWKPNDGWDDVPIIDAKLSAVK